MSNITGAGVELGHQRQTSQVCLCLAFAIGYEHQESLSPESSPKLLQLYFGYAFALLWIYDIQRWTYRMHLSSITEIK
jgi:hypothetical protein